MKKTERQSSFELLRLILMFGIIVHHSIVHGLGLSGLSNTIYTPDYITPNDMPMMMFVNALCIPAVNCFILISGYFSIKPTWQRFYRILFAMLFYTIGLTTIPYIITGNYKSAIFSCLFVSHSPYWFMIDYLLLMMFAPMLNKVYEKKTKYSSLIIVSLLIISCYLGFIWQNPFYYNGYTLIQFILMYCIGRYIRNNNFSLNSIYSIIIWIACAAITTGIMYILWHSGRDNLAWRMTYYNNPLTIIAAIAIFLWFKNLKFQNKYINFAAQSSLAIYLVQSADTPWHHIYNYIHNTYLSLPTNYSGEGILLIIMVLCTITIVVSILIDQLQNLICNITLSSIEKLHYSNKIAKD